MDAQNTGTSSPTPAPANVGAKQVIQLRVKPIIQPNGLAMPMRTFFDPWNSASTGHQRAENRLAGSTSWRDSRNLKLKSQYKAGLQGGGGQRLFDTVGAGSEEFGKDGRKENGSWERGASGLRSKDQKSMWDFSQLDPGELPPSAQRPQSQEPESTPLKGDVESVALEQTQRPASAGAKPQIFRNLVFYINGSTAPRISDHKLKYIITQHGGQLSIALGRRTVTHVILGTHNRGVGAGCGGGLAATKIQKEISRMGGKAVRYINVEWVVQSIDAGVRLPETKFANQIISIAPTGQRSVLDAFRAAKTTKDTGTKRQGPRQGLRETFTM